MFFNIVELPLTQVVAYFTRISYEKTPAESNPFMTSIESCTGPLAWHVSDIYGGSVEVEPQLQLESSHPHIVEDRPLYNWVASKYRYVRCAYKHFFDIVELLLTKVVVYFILPEFRTRTTS
jgi:hypothetical protein